MNKKEDAIELIEESSEDDAFVVYVTTPDGKLDGIQRVGNGKPEQLGQMQIGMLAAHIRGVTDHLDSDRTPAETAQVALRKLAEIESANTPGGGIVRSGSGDE